MISCVFASLILRCNTMRFFQLNFSGHVQISTFQISIAGLWRYTSQVFCLSWGCEILTKIISTVSWLKSKIMIIYLKHFRTESVCSFLSHIKYCMLPVLLQKYEYLNQILNTLHAKFKKCKTWNSRFWTFCHNNCRKGKIVNGCWPIEVRESVFKNTLKNTMKHNEGKV